jgi:hypothetical protein
MRIPAEEGQLHLGFVHSDLKAKLKTNHTDWGVSKQTQGITTTGRTLDLWSINKPQILSGTIVISNSTKSVRDVMRYRTGTIFNQKHAYRYGFSPNANCPICPCTDSALHILSGCQHTKMRNVTIERHSNTASVPIVQAIQKGPCGANQIAYTDVGSADKLTEQGLKSEKHCQQNTALLVASKTKGKGGLHRYICLWWASERKLRKKPATKPKNASKIKGTACVYVCCGVCV